MFNITQTPQFTRTVKIQTPEGDGVRTDDFQATFRWLPSDDLQEFDTSTTDGIKDLLRTILVHCGDLLGDDDQPLKWSETVRETLLGWSNARTALLLAFNTAWSEEKRGN